MDEGQITIVCKNDHSETERVQQKITQFCDLLGVKGRPLHAFNLAVDEVLTNIIRHGYGTTGDAPPHEIRIHLRVADDELSADIEDDAREFDPVKYPRVDCTKPLEERQPGGLGLHLVRSLIHGIEYRREGGKNILTLRKRVR